METWVLIVGIGIVIPAILIAMAVVRGRAGLDEPPPPPREGRSAEQKKALQRRQALGYTQNSERDL